MSERPRPPQLARRVAPAMLGAGLALLAMGADYRGCGSGSGPAVPVGGVEIPEGTGCVVDDDCVSEDRCVALACRAGTCVDVGVGQDDDGDGFAPMPCGEDCNDGDPNRFPGAGERCDGVDQDCDGIVDEGAIGARPVGIPEELDDATMVAAGDAFVVIGGLSETPAEGLYAYLVGTDGSPGPRARVGDAPALPRVALGADDGSVLVLGAGESSAVRGVTFDVSGGAIIASGTPLELGDPATLTGVHAVHFADQTWVAFDTTDDLGADPRRWLWRSGDGSVLELAADPNGGSPDLATDGSALVVTEDSQTLRFVDVDGATLASRDLPGPFADQPLADGDGEVYAVYRDAFDHAITRVRAATSTSPIAAPVGGRDDSVAIFRLDAGVLVTRIADSGLRAWVLDAELGLYQASFGPAAISPSASPPLAVTADTLRTGLSAIHSRYVGTSGVAILACETP